MFLSRADVDLRFVEFEELGRTSMSAIDSTQFDSEGHATRIGSNQIGRYAVHFHHTFGPKTAPGNGHQFTVIGNAVNGAAKWGITVHRSHHGLVQDNVVYNTRGAGIVTEDGTESFNVFEHNFSVQSMGRRELPATGGYGGSLPDVGGDGAGFWFRGPNNYIRNNVAANGERLGFALAAPLPGSVRLPAFKGADNSRAAESVDVDLANGSVLEFANNEAYGTIRTGLAAVWNGNITGLTVWHASDHGVNANPPRKAVVEKLKVRGDVSALGGMSESPVGVWVSNYISRSVTVTGADVQGMRVGVLSPFFYHQSAEAGQAGSLVVENSYFRNHIGVSVATAYTSSSGTSLKTAVVRNSRFEPLDATLVGPDWPAESISMNYGMAPRDSQARDPILVYDYNQKSGDNFKVYRTVPCA